MTDDHARQHRRPAVWPGRLLRPWSAARGRRRSLGRPARRLVRPAHDPDVHGHQLCRRRARPGSPTRPPRSGSPRRTAGSPRSSRCSGTRRCRRACRCATLQRSVRTATSPDAPMVAVSATSSRPGLAADMANAVTRCADPARERHPRQHARATRAVLAGGGAERADLRVNGGDRSGRRERGRSARRPGPAGAAEEERPGGRAHPGPLGAGPGRRRRCPRTTVTTAGPSGSAGLPPVEAQAELSAEPLLHPVAQVQRRTVRRRSGGGVARAGSASASGQRGGVALRRYGRRGRTGRRWDDFGLARALPHTVRAVVGQRVVERLVLVHPGEHAPHVFGVVTVAEEPPFRIGNGLAVSLGEIHVVPAARRALSPVRRTAFRAAGRRSPCR